MKTLDTLHAAHGWLPDHAMVDVGRRIGVGPSSVADHYRYHLTEQADVAPWRLDRAAIADAVDAADFPDAYRRLSAAGEVPAYPLVCRALWRDRSRLLNRLRDAERRRRQVLAESQSCPACDPELDRGAAR